MATRGKAGPRVLVRMAHFDVQKLAGMFRRAPIERVYAVRVGILRRLHLDRGFERPFDSTIWQMDMLAGSCFGPRAT